MTNDNTIIENWQSRLLTPNGIQLVTIVLLLFAATLFYFNNPAPPQSTELFSGYRPTPSELNRIQLAFGKSNLDGFSIESGQVWVPQNEKAAYLSSVQEFGAVPTSLDKQEETSSNPFLPKSQQLALRLGQKKQQVRDMIARLPFVREAWFEFDEFEPNSVFQDSQHSAVVMVTLHETYALTRQQVATIQGLVAGAFAKVSAKNVVVTDANMGIAYHDLDDHAQVELIEMVNWKMQRKSEHLERLSELINEFPGLKIEIEVKKPDYSKIPKIAESDRSPAIKFANYQHALTLNRSGDVLIDNAYPDQGDSKTIASVAKVSLTPERHALNPTSEIVDVHLRIPASFADSMEDSSSNKTLSRHEKIALLKSNLAARVHQSLPELSQNKALNVIVSVVSGDQNVLADSMFVRILRNYWPLFAIVFVGLINITINRKRPEHSMAEPEAKAFNQDQSFRTETLEKQLTDLIDNDPEAAAKVIKKWIRDTN